MASARPSVPCAHSDRRSRSSRSVPRGGIAAYGDDVLRVPVHPVKAVDGVGAGAAFCVGLAIATVEKRAPADALNWAAACGALATTQIGTQSAMPRRRDVARQIELSGLSRG